ESFEIGTIFKNNEKFVRILNKGSDINNGYSMAVTWNGEEMLIHMDKTYRNLLYNNFEIVQPLIFHEIGHIENGDFYKDQAPSELRMLMLDVGKVMPQELAADAFAINIVGKKAMKASLRYLLEERKKTSLPLLNYSQSCNIKEIELRIKNIH
ncbi:MAG: hypothetical protein Q4F12_05110, partial [Erysipelotrichaceae bacterium]|nr:hypothetical protein [Erysipelotrichaceae bacterium]